MTSPRPPHPDGLERELAELTSYRGEDANLWQQALDRADSEQARPLGWLPLLGTKRVSSTLLAASLVCVCLVCFAAVLVPTLGGVRNSARRAVDSKIQWAQSESESYRVAPSSPAAASTPEYVLADRPNNQIIVKDPAARVAGLGSPSFELKSKASPTAAPSDRFVVRKATMDLQSEDVRTAFAKAAHLVSEARGEFVETSSLTGEGPTARANLTLRVAADRLGAVLTELRALGTVKSENTTGEDVTSQVVDLEARLRNEQRVEAELLQLLDKRNDAPLKDILELRESLSSVRQSIEQLIGQRDRLGRLVSLSSILVVMRASDEQPRPAAASITDYFSNRLATTWTGGLRFLADTLANIVGLLIGGLLWWLLAAACIYAIYRYRRRLVARCV